MDSVNYWDVNNSDQRRKKRLAESAASRRNAVTPTVGKVDFVLQWRTD